MTSSALARLAAIAGVVGVLVAAGVAAVVPRTSPSEAAPRGRLDPTAPTPAPAGDPSRPRIAPPRPEPTDPGFVRFRLRGSARIEARTKDPHGGPDWAVRVFRADRIANPSAKVIGRPRCAQLGRIHRGRFGWIDATNTFRPVPIGYRGAPVWCGSTTPDLRGQPHIDVFTRVTDPTRGAARPLQTIVWGIVGRDGRARVTIDGRAESVALAPHGAFVAFAPARRTAPDVRAVIRYPARPPVRIDRSFRAQGRENRKQRRRIPSRGARAIPIPVLPSGRPTRIELRLPDPNGGLPWGVTAAPAEGGGWCRASLGRIVGDRVGRVDYELGTFVDAGPDANGGCPARREVPTRRRPLHFSYGGGGGFAGELGQDPLAGRTARRTLRGLTTFIGVAHPDVRTITAATPRGVRTIRPSRRAHVFAFVYDGSFPTGTVVLTSRFRDGRTHRDTVRFIL